MSSTSPDVYYLIPASLLVATLEYLSKRPFNEVADAMVALRALEPSVPEAAPPEDAA